MNRYLVDADVFVDFLRGSEKAFEFVTSNEERIILSSLVVAELYAGVKGSEELGVLDDLISLFPIIPVSAEIAKIGGMYKRDFSKSHGICIADAILAATAVVEDAELKTLNIKHYPMFKDLKSVYVK